MTRRTRAAALSVSDPKVKRQTRRSRRESEVKPEASGVAAHVHAGALQSETGPTLDQQLAMSQSETAAARLRNKELEVLIMEKNVLLEQLQTAKQPARTPIVTLTIHEIPGYYGAADFMPTMMRRMNPGDLVLVEHTGDTITVQHMRLTERVSADQEEF
ncbi:MAG TPA: hypothetical protein VJP88_08650 [Caulobacteraceae bacterium]|nr:hypothetical protein [Caulobacteraceae bacterium]